MVTKIFPSPLLSLIFLIQLVSPSSSFVLPPTPNRLHPPPPQSKIISPPTTAASSSLNSSIQYETPKLKNAFVKPSKTLTVHLEYNPTSSKLSPTDLSTLSMQLRSSSKVTSIWSRDIKALLEFIKEQSSAKGNFPGPCPIVYYDSKSCIEESIQKAVEVGVDAIVIPPSFLQSILENHHYSDSTMEWIWDVSACTSLEEIQPILDSGYGHAFLLSGTPDDPTSTPTPTPNANKETENVNKDDSTTTLIHLLPPKSIKIISLPAMMDQNQEITLGKQSQKRWKCHSILLQDALVGDEEDLAYASFVVTGLTSKKSTEFQMTGLTGSANGHFGGVEAKLEMQGWKRRERRIMGLDSEDE